MDLEKEFPGNHWEYRTLITRTNAESLGITGYAISHNCNLSTPLYVVQYGIGSDKAVEMESQGVAESIYFRNTPELSNETFLFQYQQHLKAVEEYFNSRLKGISDILEKLQ